MILVNGDTVEYEKLIRNDSPERSPIIDREQAAYGLDHCVMGFTLLNHWNMDERLVQAVFNHHSDLSNDADNELTDLLTLADYLCWKGNLGFFTEPALPSARVLARCGWDGTSSTDEVVELILEAYRAESLLFASA
jgi:HD-like signal output (HDOD) protein